MRPRALRMPSAKLIVFTRYPVPGKTKTRLIPALGPEGAADLQRQMTEHTLQSAAMVAGADCAVEVRYTGTSEAEMADWLGTDWAYAPQDQGDLGARMAGAFGAARAEGCDRTLIIGIDCPGIGPTLLRRTFALLTEHDLVLGPATDGGYYLIGLSCEAPELFEGVDWGSETVLARTLEIAAAQGLTMAQLPPLNDVDYGKDLETWAQVKQLGPSLSIIIPTLNEAAALPQTLAQIPPEPGLEVIVADGGSQDDTVALARDWGAQVVSAQGRAAQMNAGAAIARGTHLLFLHGDTQLPPDFRAQIQQVLGRPGVVAGAFQLQIAGSQRGLRLVEWGVRVRSQLWQLPYGDQGIFLSRSGFEALGGFSEQPLMEDFELIGRLKKVGKVAIATSAVTTSPRRWQKLGIWRTTWRNQKILLGHALGFSPQRLAHWYRQPPRP
jgi:rSAM/selenodomain-associated transferase 2/rSAM/selenodomain-associated transferase 1